MPNAPGQPTLGRIHTPCPAQNRVAHDLPLQRQSTVSRVATRSGTRSSSSVFAFRCLEHGSPAEKPNKAFSLYTINMVLASWIRNRIREICGFWTEVVHCS